MDGTRDYHTKWSNQRKKNIWYHLYVEPKKWYKWSESIISETNVSKTMVILVVKNPPASAGDVRDVGLIPGSERSPGEGNGTILKILGTWDESVFLELWNMYYSILYYKIHVNGSSCLSSFYNL